MAKSKSDAEWSNEPVADPDTEMKKPTPNEEKLTELAEKAKEVKPQRYDITSKNPRAMRVIHDYNGQHIAIPPGQSKRSVLLHPDTAESLGKGDLTITASGGG